MPDSLDTISVHGGAATTAELYAEGFDRYSLAREVRARRIRRARQGWFTRPDLDPLVFQAARVGGILTCSSALDVQEVWVVTDQDLHVGVARHACRMRSPHDPTKRLSPAESVTVHWRTRTCASRLLADPLTALEDYIECASPELVRASADSLVRRYPHLANGLVRLAERTPTPYRQALEGADGVCEAGTETLFWSRSRYPVPISRQVRIAGVGRVDFLLGDRLVVEVDGYKYHSDPAQFEADRRRDAALSRLGYRVLRFSFQQVLGAWDEVDAAVWAAIARGDCY